MVNLVTQRGICKVGTVPRHEVVDLVGHCNRDRGHVYLGAFRQRTYTDQVFRQRSHLCTNLQQGQDRQDLKTLPGHFLVTGTRFLKHDLRHEDLKSRTTVYPPFQGDALMPRDHKSRLTLVVR